MVKQLTILLFLVAICAQKFISASQHTSEEHSAESASEEDRKLLKCKCLHEEQNVICGSNSKEYKSLCLLKCEQKIDPKLRQVPCKNKNTTNVDLHPAAAQPTTTTESATATNSKKITRLRGRIRVSFVVPGCGCDNKKLRHVCGTNGLTYGNKCALRCAAKKIIGLKIKSHGRCDDPKHFEKKTTKQSDEEDQS